MALGWDGNYWTATEPWTIAERQWQAFRGVVPEDRRLELQYEDLVREPEAELARVCEFVGTAYHPAIFDYTGSSSYERPDPKLLDQWRRKLSPDEVRLAEARIGDLLMARGYALSGLPALEVDSSEAARLERASRWGTSARGPRTQRLVALPARLCDPNARPAGVAEAGPARDRYPSTVVAAVGGRSR